MQQSQKGRRKSLIEKMEDECNRQDNSATSKPLQLKIQLLKGVDNPEEFKIAKSIFHENEQLNLNNYELLAFLMNEGIFNNYKDLYPGHERAKPKNYVKECVSYYISASFHLFHWWGALVIPAAIVMGLVADRLIGSREEENQLDESDQNRLFLTLEKIREPGQRDFFIKTAVSLYERGWILDPTSCNNLIAALKSEISTDDKWWRLLCYMANVTENNGTAFYSIIANRNSIQDCLGFKKLSMFSLFAKEKIPKDIHANISMTFVEQSVTESLKSDWRPTC